MGTLLVLILFFCIFWPFLRMIWRFFSQARRINKFMNDPASFFSGYKAGSQASKANSAPRRSKKYSREDGEYVEFTDIACKVTNDDTGEVYYRKEEQITDIEWVDIEEEK